MGDRSWVKIQKYAIISLIVLIGIFLTVRLLDLLLIWGLYSWFFQSIVRVGGTNEYIAGAASVWLTVLALLVLPIVLSRFLFRRQVKALLIVSSIVSLWFVFLYFLSQPGEGEYFNRITGASRKVYFRDTDGKIRILPLGYKFDPHYGIKTQPVTHQVVIEYEKQIAQEQAAERRAAETAQDQKKKTRESIKLQRLLAEKESELRSEIKRLIEEKELEEWELNKKIQELEQEKELEKSDLTKKIQELEQEKELEKSDLTKKIQELEKEYQKMKEKNRVLKDILEEIKIEERPQVKPQAVSTLNKSVNIGEFQVIAEDNFKSGSFHGGSGWIESEWSFKHAIIKYKPIKIRSSKNRGYGFCRGFIYNGLCIEDRVVGRAFKKTEQGYYVARYNLKLKKTEQGYYVAIYSGNISGKAYGGYIMRSVNLSSACNPYLQFWALPIYSGKGDEYITVQVSQGKRWSPVGLWVSRRHVSGVGPYIVGTRRFININLSSYAGMPQVWIKFVVFYESMTGIHLDGDPPILYIEDIRVIDKY